MIDKVTQLGYFEVDAPAVAANGAGSGVLNLIATQAQGLIAFVRDTVPNTASGGTLITVVQTSSDNSNWTNVANATFPTVTNAANSGGIQAVFVDSAILSQYNRTFDAITGTAPNFIDSVVAVYPQKNA